jgi:hypothetical protein
MKKEEIEALNIRAIKYRGTVLNEICVLEKYMDNFITDYFTSNHPHKSFEMQLLIVGDNRISFESKRQVFHFLAETYYSDWYGNYTSPRNLISKKGVFVMNKDFTFVIEQRNILAHRILDVRGQKENDPNLYFLTYKNELKEEPMSEESFIELISVIQELSLYLFYGVTKK